VGARGREQDVRRLCALGLTFALLLMAAGGAAIAQGDPTRGEYLLAAGGCVACHTEASKAAAPLAGGRAIDTPFGTFYGPNITPDPQTGIGRWQEADFMAAMRRGVRPDGSHYFPAFPYTSFTNITDEDLRDLWAYLRTVAPSSRPSRPHELSFPFSVRALMGPWKWLFFKEGPFVGDASRTPVVNRGAYLVEALAHCGQCHTPRNLVGGLEADRHLAGAPGEGDKRIPNITPTRLGKWSDDELREFLLTGITPDFDSANAIMSEVIENTTSKLTPDDLDALIAYLRSVPPLP
jgi:mono/diheme cytochrome c family protein